MATQLQYIMQPDVFDLPPGTDPASLAWLGRWSSGYLCHMGQADVKHAADNGVYAVVTRMAWSEYQRLLDEAHWYERA